MVVMNIILGVPFWLTDFNKSKVDVDGFVLSREMTYC